MVNDQKISDLKSAIFEGTNYSQAYQEKWSKAISFLRYTSHGGRGRGWLLDSTQPRLTPLKEK